MTKVLDLKLHFRIFPCGLITILAERLHEFKFPESSTTRADTVVELELGTACGRYSSTVCEAARSNSIGSLFFSPLCQFVYVCESCNLHADVY